MQPLWGGDATDTEWSWGVVMVRWGRVWGGRVRPPIRAWAIWS
ncbi:hypothetical protein [Actinoplanes sp. NPDC049265]